jgi:hypothetical protein
MSLLLTGCASLQRSAADEPACGRNLQEQKQLKPGDEPVLDLLYYLLSMIGPAFSGR